MLYKPFFHIDYSDSDDNTSTSNTRSTASILREVRHSTSVHDMSDQERIWRSSAYDYETRYIGHCNTTTDIKEANFFGRFVIFFYSLYS